MTEKILSMSEYNLDNVKELHKLKRKISFLMAESFQNIVRHGDQQTTSGSGTNTTGLFFTRNIGSVVCITSVNLIDNDQVEDLHEKLISINQLDQDELKKLYMEILSNEELSSKGGAGLGLIEMARRSGQKLEFDFEKIDDFNTLFYLGIKLEGKDTLNTKHTPIEDAKEFQNGMTPKNLLMCYKGDFSQDSIMSVLKMMEESMQQQAEKSTTKKRTFMAMVELSQNISTHSKQKNSIHEGIITIGKSNNSYIISAGNVIDNKEIPSLTQQLDHVIQLSKDELRELYKKNLRESSHNGNSGGLGLINLARDSSEKLKYEFTAFDENTSFYSINVII
ncbi:MAG: hypothetical protein COA57_07875 [Flavobacteriales bacterium]|nr:MAG: hypothetical protein COA57_07875 [Flavobacteriales bacterium]